MPTKVKHDAPADGQDGPRIVLTASEARNRRIPLCNQKYAPAGQDPKECFRGARRARDATLQDGDVAKRDAPGAATMGSTDPERIEAPPPVVLFEYMWEDSI